MKNDIRAFSIQALRTANSNTNPNPNSHKVKYAAGRTRKSCSQGKIEFNFI